MGTSSTSIGAFEAKTKFSELLERVRQGEEITITRHEKPIARLVPFQRSGFGDIAEAFHQMEGILRRTRRKAALRKDLCYRQLIEEGRRR